MVMVWRPAGRFGKEIVSSPIGAGGRGEIRAAVAVEIDADGQLHPGNTALAAINKAVAVAIYPQLVADRTGAGVAEVDIVAIYARDGADRHRVDRAQDTVIDTVGQQA